MWRRLFLSVSFAANLVPGQSSEIRRGDALFHGTESLIGRVRGHDETLPSDAVRCANCHDAVSAGRLTRVAAPHLDRSLLLDPKQRRGGPPSHYDQPAFCKLLRTGIDPASIVVAREMPVYDLDEAACASLWSFIIGKEPVNAKH